MRPAIYAIVAIWMLPLVAYGQQRLIPAEHTQPTSMAPDSVETGELRTLPIRQLDRSRYTSWMADIEERMPEQHVYRVANDLSTSAHETIHGINSRLRNEIGAGVGAFYVGKDRVWILRTPKTSLSRVAARTPANVRDGRIYPLYMQSQQRDWEDEPLYILDEWVAYLGGTEASIEAFGAVKTTPDTSTVVSADVESCVLLSAYATVLIYSIEQDDPNYPDLDKLKEFVALNARRTLALAEIYPQSLMPHVQTTYYQRYYNCQDGSCEVPVAQTQQWRTPTPQPLAAIPPKPATSTVKSCNCDNNVMLTEINKLKAEIADIKAHPERYVGPQGPMGPQGIGVPGLNGKDGKDGTTPTVETVVTEAVKQIRELPIEFQNVDGNNRIVSEPVKAYLGGKVAFRLSQ